jgi:hypothetical protein
MNPDRAVQYLTTAWIVNMRTVSVLDCGGQPANHGVPDVVRRPLWIFRKRWSIVRNYRIAKSSGLERVLPVFDSFLNPRDPLGWSRGIDVVHNRLDRWRNRRIRKFLLELPSSDVSANDRTVLLRTEIRLTHLEESDTPIREPWHHRL